MEFMEQLIDSATQKLENTTRNSDMVGNRPHFPMYVIMNGKNTGGAYRAIYRQIERIWPQTVTKLTFSSYDCCNSDVVITDLATGNPMVMNDIRTCLDNVKMIRNVFAEMKQWCVYNIIDTSGYETVEEFKMRFSAISYLRNAIVDSFRSMLIVLLDDSANHRNTAHSIKLFLADHSNEYDGTFVIANRTKSNEMFQISELYRIAANILILSNNDAVSRRDDQEYSARVSCFYNNHVNTVAYSLLERPNRKIAIQLINFFLDSAQISIDTGKDGVDAQQWRKIFGIENNKLQVCEEFLKTISIPFDNAALEYMPWNNYDNGISSFETLTYLQFKSLSFEGVLQQFIDNYYRMVFLPGVDISRCIDRFKDTVLNNLSAADALLLADEMIEQIFLQIDSGVVNQNSVISEYIMNQMKHSIRENIIYPRCKETLKNICSDAKMTLEEFKKVRSEFKQFIPLDGFENIGSMYRTIAEIYLKSTPGERDLKALLCAGNRYGDILDQLLNMVSHTVEYNKKNFSLSFIDEWEERLNLAGDIVYKQIRSTLDENAHDKIHLFGNFPIEEKLQVYMFHTCDANGNQETDLCDHLRRAYEGIQGTQFFNTGFDDALEAIKIVDCSGDKLKI